MNKPVMPIVSVKNLSIGFSRNRPLFRGLDLEVLPGQVCIVKGKNGAGKSTLLKLLGQQSDVSYTGDIRFARQMGKRNYLPQSYQSSFHLPLSLHDVIRIGTGFVDFDCLGLLTKSDLQKAWQTASGGEKQKTIFIRTLAQQPNLLLLDEPTNHLDSYSIGKYWRALQSYILEAPAERACILVTHVKAIPEFDQIECQTINLQKFTAHVF